MVVNNNEKRPDWQIKQTSESKIEPNLKLRIPTNRTKSEPIFKFDYNPSERKKLKRTTLDIRPREPCFCTRAEFENYIELYKKTSSNICVINFGSRSNLLNNKIESRVSFCNQADYTQFIELYNKKSSTLAIKGSANNLVNEELNSLEEIETNNLEPTSEQNKLVPAVPEIIYHQSIKNFQQIFEYHIYPFNIHYITPTVCSSFLKSAISNNSMPATRFYEISHDANISGDNWDSPNDRKHSICKYERDKHKDADKISERSSFKKSSDQKFKQFNPRTQQNGSLGRRQLAQEKFYNRNVIMAPSPKTKSIFSKEELQPRCSKSRVKNKCSSSSNNFSYDDDDDRQMKLEIPDFKFFGKPRFPKKFDKYSFHQPKYNFTQNRFNKNGREPDTDIISIQEKLMKETKKDIEENFTSIIAPLPDIPAKIKKPKINKNIEDIEAVYVNKVDSPKTSEELFLKSEHQFSGRNTQCLAVGSICSNKSRVSKNTSVKICQQKSSGIKLSCPKKSLPKAASISEKFDVKKCVTYNSTNITKSACDVKSTKPKRSQKLGNLLPFTNSPSLKCKRLTSQVFPTVNIQPKEPKVVLKDQRYNPGGCAKVTPKIIQGCFIKSHCFPLSTGSNKDLSDIIEPCFPETCGPLSHEPCEVRYSTAIISTFEDFTTYEILKSSSRRPSKLKNIIEDVFVVRT